MCKTGHLPAYVAFTLLLVALILAACEQPYSQQPGVTNTPIDPGSLFETPIDQTPGITMSDVANFGTSTALTLSGTPQAVETQTLAAVQPSGVLTFSKTVSPQTYSRAGETITFTYTITNTGTVPLGPSQFTVSDNLLGTPFNCGTADITLAPGQGFSCSAPYIITQADLALASLTSIAIISGGGQTSAPAAVSILNLAVSGPQTPGILATPSTESEPSKSEASYVIVAPLSLMLDDNELVELHLSRSLTRDQISTQIVATKALATSTSQAGTLVAPGGPPVQLPGGVLEVTRYMRVTLQAADPEAFVIRAPNENPVKAVNPSGIVIWQWQVQARKGGVQNLIFFIEQQSIENNLVSWQSVATEKKVIQVNVTIGQRLGTLDWEWIAGTIITLIAIPALWRWIDVLQRKSNPRERSRHKRDEVSQPSTQKNVLSRLPGLAKAEGEDSETLGNIFISYRRSDSADIAGRIYDRLIEEFGPNPIFKDVDSIPLGVDFKKYLDLKVGECNVFLAIIGDRWLDATDATGKKRLDDRADFVRVEIESALKREIPVIPLLVRGAQMPVAEHLPYSLRRLVFKNGIQIRPDPDFHRDMDRLISALHEHI